MAQTGRPPGGGGDASRNRDCPKCQQGVECGRVEAQQKRILNTHYLHVVFTLPPELRRLAASKPELIYTLWIPRYHRCDVELRLLAFAALLTLPLVAH